MAFMATKPASAAAKRESPVRRLAKASTQCSAHGKAYAQCIFAAQFAKEATGVEKDVCKTEFQAFKQCVQEKMGRKW